MSGALSMMGVESPASMHSTDSRVSKHTSKPSSRSSDRPSYRLFPSVEPTPPASPVHRRIIAKPTETRRRSSSLDDSIRPIAERQDVTLKHVPVKRGRKVSVTEVKPMSTVQESSADSPTVPAMYTSPPLISEDFVHNRSSSAPGEYNERMVKHERVPSASKLRPNWRSRHTDAPSPAVHGLGLTLPADQFTPRQPRRQGPPKAKPNLTINVGHEDRPPPPPPKSPRHSRNPSVASVQSGVSSMHGELSDSVTVVTPGSLVSKALLDTKGEPLPTPLPMQAQQASYLQSNGPIRVREVAISKDRSKESEAPPPLPSDPRTNKPVASKLSAPDVDKPMPSLPTPTRRFSAHIREVREAERFQTDSKHEAAPSTSNSQSAARVEMSTRSKSSSDPSHLRGKDPIQPSSQALRETTQASIRDVRSPTPDLASRPQSPANLLQTVSASAKVLPILPTEGPPRSRSATPDSSATRLRPLEPKSSRSDPLQTLEDLSKQCEGLHARYASLRAERVKISTAISLSLREEKPSSDYTNYLLDQHLSLNAINSSMDICFAKLKSLDCRKEEAMATFIRQAKAKSALDDARKSMSANSFLAPPSIPASGRSTPELGAEQKSLTPELAPTSKFSSNGVPTPAQSPERKQSPKSEPTERKDVSEPEKRITIIHASTQLEAPTESPSLPPISPVSAISSIGDTYATKRIRIKGAKAAKILGLVTSQLTNSKGITLPDESPGMPATFKKPIAVEVEIQRKPSQGKKKTTPPSPSTPKMPKRKPPPAPKHEVKGSVSSSVASSITSSQTESSPEEPEVLTPTGTEDEPFGLRSAKRGMVQTIQVMIDDDILEYYKTGGA